MGIVETPRRAPHVSRDPHVRTSMSALVELASLRLFCISLQRWGWGEWRGKRERERERESKTECFLSSPLGFFWGFTSNLWAQFFPDTNLQKKPIRQLHASKEHHKTRSRRRRRRVVEGSIRDNQIGLSERKWVLSKREQAKPNRTEPHNRI
jgi:hypothetical protein